MSKMSKLLIATAFCAVALPSAAMAVTITGSSGGSFASLTSCDDSGSNADCRIVNTVANGTNTQVQWGSTSRDGDGFNNPSTLTADDLTINAVTNATGVQIGKLTWFNSATTSDSELASFGVNYTLSVAFTSPNNSSDSQLFSLTITNPTNPPGDVISSFTLAELSGLSFSLNGVTISNLRYSADGATSLCSGGTSWCDPEEGTGNLYILADFTATAVPEPLTLSLFGAGLAGAAAIRRRKQTKA
jgi:hypothetical protein